MKKRIISCVIVIAILAGVIGVSLFLGNEDIIKYGKTSGTITYTNDEQNEITNDVINADVYTVTENDKYILNLSKSADISIIDKDTGRIWSAVPEGGAEINEKYGSSIAIHYHTGTASETILYSMTECVAKNQFKVFRDGDGIRVEYLFGEVGFDYVYPSVISEERFKKVIKSMSKENAEYISSKYTLYELDFLEGEIRELLIKQYPRLEKENIYVTDVTSKPTRKKMSEIFMSVGYTNEDRIRDEGGTNDDVEKPKVFKVAVNYSLTEMGFKAWIEMKHCEFYTDFPMTRIELLPYFDSYLSGESGYIVYPSGSGALINIDSKSSFEETVRTSVYGTDSVLNQEIYNADTACPLPIFGGYKNNSAYLCILNDGEQQADIIANKSPDLSSVYASFMILDNAAFSMAASNAINMFAVDVAVERVAAEYILFNSVTEENAYSEMANYYRNRLEQENAFSDRELSDVNVLAEIPSVINYNTLFAGSIPVNKEYAVTEFNDIEKISSELGKSIDPQNLAVLIKGWNQKGISAENLGKWNFSKAAGGESEFVAMAKKLKSQGVQLYTDVTLNVVNTSLSKGFSADSDLARSLNNKIVHLQFLNMQTNKKIADEKVLISPRVFSKIFNKYQNDIPENTGLGLSYFTSVLYGDYCNDTLLTREQSIAEIEKILKSSKDFNILGNVGNLYSLQHLTLINNLSTDSCENNIFGKSIPFVQMVFHGNISYVMTEQNGSENPQKALLKAIESGSGLHYVVTSELYEDLFETEYAYLYDTLYDNLKDEIVSQYKTVSKALEGLGNQKIVLHTYLSDDVVKTVYENGTTIIVNYSKYDYVFNGETIAGLSYLRK